MFQLCGKHTYTGCNFKCVIDNMKIPCHSFQEADRDFHQDKQDINAGLTKYDATAVMVLTYARNVDINVS